jgi:hypothetical protein
MTKHAKISYIKSAVRFLACFHLALVPTHLHAAYGAALLFAVAEVLGVVEEFGE